MRATKSCLAAVVLALVAAACTTPSGGGGGGGTAPPDRGPSAVGHSDVDGNKAPDVVVHMRDSGGTSRLLVIPQSLFGTLTQVIGTWTTTSFSDPVAAEHFPDDAVFRIGDVDLDLRADAVVMRPVDSGGVAISYFAGQPDATFSTVPQPLLSDPTLDLGDILGFDVADVGGDGSDDVVLRVRRGDGRGELRVYMPDSDSGSLVGPVTTVFPAGSVLDDESWVTFGSFTWAPGTDTDLVPVGPDRVGDLAVVHRGTGSETLLTTFRSIGDGTFDTVALNFAHLLEYLDFDRLTGVGVRRTYADTVSAVTAGTGGGYMIARAMPQPGGNGALVSSDTRDLDHAVGRGEVPPGTVIANAGSSWASSQVLREGPSGDVELQSHNLGENPSRLPATLLTVPEPFDEVVEVDGFGVQCRLGQPCVPPTCEMCWGDPMPRPEQGTVLSGHWERITAGSDGDSGDATVSPDGSKIAFRSTATDLTAAPDAPGTMDVFVHDRDTGTTAQVTDSSDGVAWNTWVQDVDDDGDVLYTRDLDGSRRLLSGAAGASPTEILPVCPGSDGDVARWDAAGVVRASCETDLGTSTISAGGRTALWVIAPGQAPVLEWESYVDSYYGTWLTGGVQALSPSGRRVRMGDESMGFNLESPMPQPFPYVQALYATEPLPPSGVGDFRWIRGGGAADNELRPFMDIRGEVTTPGGIPQLVTTVPWLSGDSSNELDFLRGVAGYASERALQAQIAPGGALVNLGELSESTNDIVVEGGADFWEYADVQNSLRGVLDSAYHYLYQRADLGAGNVTSMSYHAEVVAAHTAHSPVGGDSNGSGMDVFVWVRD